MLLDIIFAIKLPSSRNNFISEKHMKTVPDWTAEKSAMPLKDTLPAAILYSSVSDYF